MPWGQLQKLSWQSFSSWNQAIEVTEKFRLFELISFFGTFGLISSTLQPVVSDGISTWPTAASLSSFNCLFVLLQSCPGNVNVGPGLEGGSSMMEASALWKRRAPLSARTPDAEPLWQAASRISSEREDWSLLSALCISVCRKTESWSWRGCWTSTGVCVDPSDCRCTTTTKDSAPTGVTADHFCLYVTLTCTKTRNNFTIYIINYTHVEELKENIPFF